MFNIDAMLDRAKDLNGFPSDYKLALVTGISHGSINSYRKGNTLPDERVLSKLCELSGDDPYLMTAQIQYERAKTDEARSVWAGIAERLKLTTKTAQAGFSTVASMAAIIVVCSLLVLAQSVFAPSPTAKASSEKGAGWVYIMLN